MFHRNSISKFIKRITKLRVKSECYPEINRILENTLVLLIKNSERVALLHKKREISLSDVVIASSQILRDDITDLIDELK